jgi:hypothetical protein
MQKWKKDLKELKITPKNKPKPMKTTTLTIALLFLLSSCAYIHKLTAPKTESETNKTVVNEQKNEIETFETSEVSLNIEAKSNQCTEVDLNFQDTKASFMIEYKKATNQYGGGYAVYLTEEANPENKVTFAGKSGYIKKYQSDEDFDDKAFSEIGKVFLQAKTAGDYTVTDVNSMPFDNSNYAVFKVTNSTSNKIIYGWINFMITPDKVTFIKMGYLDKLPLTVGG